MRNLPLSYTPRGLGTSLRRRFAKPLQVASKQQTEVYASERKTVVVTPTTCASSKNRSVSSSVAFRAASPTEYIASSRSRPRTAGLLAPLQKGPLNAATTPIGGVHSKRSSGKRSTIPRLPRRKSQQKEVSPGLGDRVGRIYDQGGDRNVVLRVLPQEHSPSHLGQDALDSTLLYAQSSAQSSSTRKLLNRFVNGYICDRGVTEGKVGKDYIFNFLGLENAEVDTLEETRPTSAPLHEDHYTMFASQASEDVIVGSMSNLMKHRRLLVRTTRQLLDVTPRKRSPCDQNTPSVSVYEGSSSLYRVGDSTPLKESTSDVKTNEVSREKSERRLREACESMRILVFGPHGNRMTRDGGGWYEQKRGTKEEIRQIHHIWAQIDADGSGDVDLDEFLTFFDTNREHRLLGMRCVSYFSAKAKGERGGCTVEDIMRLIFLKATDEDIDFMLRCYAVVEHESEWSETPPLLSRRKRQQILENFPKFLKTDCSDATVDFKEISESGVIDTLTLHELWDIHGMGTEKKLTIHEILELFCPDGYRAHENVKHAIRADGVKLVHVSNTLFEGWIRAEGAQAIQKRGLLQANAPRNKASTISIVDNSPSVYADVQSSILTSAKEGSEDVQLCEDISPSDNSLALSNFSLPSAANIAVSTTETTPAALAASNAFCGTSVIGSSG